MGVGVRPELEEAGRPAHSRASLASPGAMSSEPCGLSGMSLAPGAPLCPSPTGQGAAAAGLPLNEALNPFPARAPELLVRFYSCLGNCKSALPDSCVFKFSAIMLY